MPGPAAAYVRGYNNGVLCVYKVYATTAAAQALGALYILMMEFVLHLLPWSVLLSVTVIPDLDKARFILNIPKSCLDPVQIGH